MILVTGGAGFIGLNFVKYLVNKNEDVLVIDKLTYASNPEELLRVKCQFNQVDICNRQALESIFVNNSIDVIFHFAAESHVDNSIKSCLPFIESNIIGTVNLLDMAVKFKVKEFIHISTDEVFGSVISEPFNEQSQISPRNPYSASKAAAEHFVQAYANTYGLKYKIINSSNNYGPWQHKEKLIPKTISNILKGEKVPVYGNGQQIRDWIYVEDTCEALYVIYEKGHMNERYCIGGDNQWRNINLVAVIITMMRAPFSSIQFVEDRPGHDEHYQTDISKMKTELNWMPIIPIEIGLEKTIEWMKKQ